MALLNKLLNPSFLKPKWQHPDATVRKQALAHLDDEKVLVQIAQQDSNKDVRLLALSKIRAVENLAEFLVSEHADLRKQAQHQHLVHLLPNQSRNDLVKISNDNDLVSIATYTHDDELRLAAIEQLSDESLRLEIACHNPVAKVRLAAAQGITNSAALQSLMSIAQGKDKALYRFCKDQLANAKAEQDAAIALQEKINACIKSAEQLSTSAYSPEYNGRVQLLKQNWASLTQQSTQQTSHFEQAISMAEATLAQHQAEEKALAEKNAAIEAAKNTFVSVLSALEDIEFNADISTRLADLQQAWQDAKQHCKPEAEQHKLFENRLQAWLALENTRTQLEAQEASLTTLIEQSQQLDNSSLIKTQALQKELTQALKQLPWKPAAINSANKAELTLETPALLLALDKALQRVIKHNQNLASHEIESSKQLAKILFELENHIDEGHLKEANKSHQQAVQALKKISQQENKKFQRQFQSLTARLSEIRDWQGFAATPKKEALCESMEALIGRDLDPELLAEKIHSLQEEWKTIGPIARADDKVLWNRFRAAADKAYEPCKAFYADMAALRQKNLEQRQQLVEQLTQYEANMDWDNADWVIVQKTLDAARETFRSFSPVDRSEHKNSQASLQAIADKIYAHIKAEYQRNIEAKEALVAQATALQDVEDLSQAIEESKQLQAHWKTIGLTPNKVDQKLWQSFRAACNAVFSRRDEQREQNKANIDADIKQAESIISQAEALVASPADSSDTQNERKAELQQCQTLFAQLTLPKAVHGKLRARLSAALQQQEDSALQTKLAKKQQAWTLLADKLSAISLKPTDTQQANSLFQPEADDQGLPKGIAAALLDEKWQAITEASLDTVSDESDLRDACIALEILAGLESSAEDQQARMALQVRRLAQGLGQAANTQQQLIDSVSHWLTLNANPAWQQRYNTALLAAAKQL